MAPRDDVAGGTWLGVNAAGVFVGITNRYLGPKDDARVSRGALVTRALALPSARIHVPGLRYGTRSGTAIALADVPAKSRMLWAEGPPCTTPFAPIDLSLWPRALLGLGVPSTPETR